MTPSQRAEEVAAQCWCDPKVSDRVMDVELCKVFAAAMQRFAEEAHHDCTTTHKDHKCFVCRNAALDEAAGIAENLYGTQFHGKEERRTGRKIASNIRALKSEAK